MRATKRRPVPPGEILTEEFLRPLGLTQGQFAEAMGVPRKQVNENCNGRRGITVATALLLERVLGTSSEFWLNAQRRSDIWEAMHSRSMQEKLERVKPVKIAA